MCFGSTAVATPQVSVVVTGGTGEIHRAIAANMGMNPNLAAALAKYTYKYAPRPLRFRLHTRLLSWSAPTGEDSCVDVGPEPSHPLLQIVCTRLDGSVSSSDQRYARPQRSSPGKHTPREPAHKDRRARGSSGRHSSTACRAVTRDQSHRYIRSTSPCEGGYPLPKEGPAAVPSSGGHSPDAVECPGALPRIDTSANRNPTIFSTSRRNPSDVATTLRSRVPCTAAAAAASESCARPRQLYHGALGGGGAGMHRHWRTGGVGLSPRHPGHAQAACHTRELHGTSCAGKPFRSRRCDLRNEQRAGCPCSTQVKLSTKELTTQRQLVAKVTSQVTTTGSHALSYLVTPALDPHLEETKQAYLNPIDLRLDERKARRHQVRCRSMIILR